MRRYRLLPTVLATVVFLVVANLLVLRSLPAPKVTSPEDGAWLACYALLYDDPPDSLDDAGLARLLARLDPAAPAIGAGYAVVSYQVGRQGAFALELRHRASGTVFRVTQGGVGHGR